MQLVAQLQIKDLYSNVAVTFLMLVHIFICCDGSRLHMISYHQKSCRSMHKVPWFTLNQPGARIWHSASRHTKDTQVITATFCSFWFFFEEQADQYCVQSITSVSDMSCSCRKNLLYWPTASEPVFGYKCLAAILQYSRGALPSLRPVTLQQWDGLFLIWHPQRKNYTSVGAGTGRAE